MKKLHTNVNIVPVIGKADTLTLTEMKKLKQRVCVSCEIIFNITVELCNNTDVIRYKIIAFKKFVD